MPVTIEKRKEYIRQWREANRDRVNGYAHKHVEANRDLINERNRQRRKENLSIDSYYRNRAKGLCGNCQRPPALGKTRCEFHLEKDRLKAAAKRIENPEHHRTVTSRYRSRRIDTGLCISCDQPPLPGKTQCQRHRDIARERSTRSHYNITEEERKALREITNCTLCGGEFSGSGVQRKAQVIDHDHVTGKIRGVIHQQCNTALGMFEDNISLLQLAINYLQRNLQ